MYSPIYWIQPLATAEPLLGRLAIVPRPRGGDWLADEVWLWQQAGLQTIISLLEPHEAEELALRNEALCCATAGLAFLNVPLVDRSVPNDAVAFAAVINTLATQLRTGRHLGIHCRQSVGRAGLLTTSILLALGVGLTQALEWVSASRGCTVPETAAQLAWLNRFAANFNSTPDSH